MIPLEHVPIVQAFGGAITCGGPLLGSDEPTPKPCHEHHVTRVTPTAHVEVSHVPHFDTSGMAVGCSY